MYLRNNQRINLQAQPWPSCLAVLAVMPLDMTWGCMEAGYGGGKKRSPVLHVASKKNVVNRTSTVDLAGGNE